MNKFIVYSKPDCLFCTRAKNLLTQYGLDFEVLDVNVNSLALAVLRDRGFKTVPQIFVNNEHIGGFTELVRFIEANYVND